MAKDPNEITVGLNGTVYTAPVGTTEPADIDEALDAAWTDLGFTNEDGLTITKSRNVNVIRVWQSFYPQRRLTTEQDLVVAFALRQFGGIQVETALEGEITEDSAGKYRFTPNDPEVIAEHALLCTWSDGDKDFRLIVPKVTSIEAVEFVVNRSDPSDLPLSFGILGEEGAEPWYMLSNDPSWADALASA